MTEIRIPDLGDFDAVVVVEVHVVDGQEVKENDPIITLETEKAAMDVTAMHKGPFYLLVLSLGIGFLQGTLLHNSLMHLLYTQKQLINLTRLMI